VSSTIPVGEDFAGGEPVLVGSERELPVFVAAPAHGIDAARLERLERLGGGLVVLGLDDAIVAQLELPELESWMRSRLDLPFTASIDASRGVGAGWSLADRALTMRIAADPNASPSDLAIPGHVHPARIRGDDLLTGGGAAHAALELARISGQRPAVALSPVVDRDGGFASLAAVRDSRELSGLGLASTEDLRETKRADLAALAQVACELPTRAGLFRLLAHFEDGDSGTTLALVHGDLDTRRAPLVHVHRACLLADVFGSRLCQCRATLDHAIAEIVREGAGVCVYSKPTFSTHKCGSARAVDAAVVAGLLRAAGVSRLRLADRDTAMIARLRALGLAVAAEHELCTAI
jgi:3,4-dihydroxy 2-butanone 4-phosphate synthase / GTP cyclohydrolase II